MKLFYFTENLLLIEILKSFSIIKNTKTLLITSNEQDAINCLYGIRLFAMIIATIIHTYELHLDDNIVSSTV